MIRASLLILLPLLLGGCLASAVKTIVTAPIKAVEVIYDTATESQEEADIKRGRAARKQDEAAEREAKKAKKARKAEQDRREEEREDRREDERDRERERQRRE
ncbi:hypothetical protein [Sandarakinorhabdus sp.]|uniref:hypothetical protein n=1 Tax=Sandarakinorhabdus sp. TaxID=1916663 RepID=UPI00333EB0D5